MKELSKVLRPGDQHLTEEEVERLSRIQRASVQEDNSRDWTVKHLSECPDCQRRLEHTIAVNDKLASVRAVVPTSRGDSCPGEGEWLNLAAGVKTETDSRRMLEHASNCDYCGPLLNDATLVLSEESSPEEKELLTALESGRGRWQSAMAERMALRSRGVNQGRESSWWKSNASVFRLSWATAFAAVLVLVAWAAARFLAKPDVNSLLASAYTEQRTIELRIAGAEYSPLRVARGAGASRLDRPQALLSAEELIGRKLVERPGASEWLQAKARADLLDGNYEAALKTLSALPESPDVLTDLATAYYEKGEATGEPANFGNAVDALGKALAKVPSDNVALYNRALVCERVLLYSQAMEDWENYLKKDGSSKWATEAREHLQRLKEKEQHREKSRTGRLQSRPDADQPKLREGSADLEDRFEDYLALLSDVSLPDEREQHFRREFDRREKGPLVDALARTAKREHGDAWLKDLLAANSPTLHRGVANLAKAVIANARADSASAQRYATEAELLFNAGPKRNAAGELRAKFEATFAARIDQDGSRCLKDAYRAEAEAINRSYVWLETQFLLEQGSCQWLLGNLGDARDKYLAAAEVAKARGYQSLFLRSQDHLSGIEIETGNYETAWRITSAALALFWSGNYEDVRGYNLYYNLYELSRLRHQPYLQLAAWRDGVKLSESSQDVAQKAMAHALLGNSAWEIHDQHTSIEELEIAASLFALSPETRSTRLAQLETESRRATMETALGDGIRAAARLRPLEDAVDAVHDPYLSVLFYTSLGDAELQQGDVSRAESALRSAVKFAELQLASLKDENSRVDWNAKSGSAYRNLVELQFERGNANEALKLWESYRGAPLRGKEGPASSQFASPAEGEHIQNVVYALLPRSLAIWVSSSHGVRAFWARRQPGKIEQQVDHFERLCAHPQSDRAALIRQGKELYVELVAPIESFVSWTGDLIVEPDDAMTGLAFEALSDPAGHYLGEKTPLIVSLGAYYEHKSRQALPITPNLPVLVVAIRSSSVLPELSLPPLPDAQAEGEGVAFRFRNAHLLTGSDANEKAVLTALPHSSVFHFSGHALSSPKRSGLLLSESLLKASALDASRVSALQLAVLSACASEGGSNGTLTDGDSLVRTLLSRGVPHVVASRWEVDSRTTSRFMALFYEKLLSGDSVPKAIRKAQASLRADPETAHPFYWCAFVAFGRD